MNYIEAFDYDANGNLTYHGWAQVGSATSESSWRIVKISYNPSNQPVSTGFASSSPTFTQIWDNRTTLNYA